MSARLVCCRALRLGLRHRSRHRQQLSRLGDIVGTVAVGEQPVVADAVKALGQHVGEEPADELARPECQARSTE